MMVFGNDTNFVYLNQRLSWPGFALNDLGLDSAGVLRLARVPRKISVVERPESDPSVATFDLGPAGIAISHCCLNT